MRVPSENSSNVFSREGAREKIRSNRLPLIVGSGFLEADCEPIAPPSSLRGLTRQPMQRRRKRKIRMDARVEPRMTSQTWDGCRKRSARHGKQVEHRVAGEPLDMARSGDRPALRVGFVIALDLLEIVEVIDHQPVRLAQAFRRSVGEPVDLLEPGAVAEVEAGDRV